MKKIILVLLLLLSVQVAQADYPGFAVGTFHNGNAYQVGQTFVVEETAVLTGFAVYFGDTTGAPLGRVLLSLYNHESAEKLLQRAYLPEPLQLNLFDVPDFTLFPGVYRFTLGSIQQQTVGNHWNVIATQDDVYSGGTLLQNQVGSDVWGEWEQDVISRVYFEQTEIIISPRPMLLQVLPEDLDRTVKF